VNGIVGTVLFGIVASVASVLALRDGRALKKREGGKSWPLTMFWGCVTFYMVSFTLLRVVHLLAPGYEMEMFYLQTIAGASTLIALMYILLGIWLGPEAARWGLSLAASAAFVTVFLIFHDGLLGPRVTYWSVELVPANALARALVGFFYVVTPVAISLVVLRAVRGEDAVLRRRIGMFAISVMMLYVPNAGKYTTFVEGIPSLLLAATMAVGAVVGWRSYLGNNG
jgi:hypothetical protein